MRGWRGTLAAVTSAQTVTITASYSGTSAEANLSVTAGPAAPPFTSLLCPCTFQPVGYPAFQANLEVLPNAGNTTYTATIPLINWPSGTASNNNQTFTFNTVGTGFSEFFYGGLELSPVTSATLSFTITPNQVAPSLGNLSGTFSVTGTPYASGGAAQTVSGTIIGTYLAQQ